MAAGLRHVAAAGVAILALAACTSGSVASLAPSSPGVNGTPAIRVTRDALAAALAARGFQLVDPQTPRRPAEAAALANSPRGVFQVILRDDPGHGFVSVYDLGDPGAALAAAREQADYVGSPVGRVQFPTGTQFVVRQLGSTVIFYAAVPRSSPDPAADEIPAVLETLGRGVPVPA